MGQIVEGAEAYSPAGFVPAAALLLLIEELERLRAAARVVTETNRYPKTLRANCGDDLADAIDRLAAISR